MSIITKFFNAAGLFVTDYIKNHSMDKAKAESYQAVAQKFNGAKKTGNYINGRKEYRKEFQKRKIRIEQRSERWKAFFSN